VKVIKSYLKEGGKIYWEGSLPTSKLVDNADKEKYST
jgi:single-stranded DNA-binding protein